MDLYVLIVISIFNLWLGWRVLRSNTSSATNILFFLFILITIAWSTANYIATSYLNVLDTDQSIFWVRFTMLFAVAQAVSFFFLVHTFPEPKVVLKKKYFYGLTLFGVITMIVALSPFLFVSVTVEDGAAVTNPGPGMALFLLVAAGSVIAGLIKLIRKYRKASGIEKIQLRYVFLGLSLMFVLILTFNLVLVVFFKNLSFVTLAPLFTLPFLAAIFYAITRHRLMDVRFIIKKTTVYIASIVCVLLIALALYWLEINFFKDAIGPGVWGPIVLLIGLIIHNPIKKRFENIANKHFFTSLYNYQATLEKLGKKLTYTINLSEIVDSIITTIKQTMHLDRAGVLLYDEKSSNYKIYRTEGFTESNGISLVRNNFLTNYLIQSRKPILYQELESLQGNGNGDKAEIAKLKANMQHIEAHICLPLLVKDKLIGIIVLGQKISKDAYTKEDLGLLEAVANQASIAVENARLYNNMEEMVTAATAKLKKMLRTQSEFLDIASHQLRTPVSLIRGIISMMLDGDLAKLPQAKQNEFLQTIKDKSDKLEVIINDILSASDFDSQKFALHPNSPEIQLDDVVDAVVKSSGEDARQRDIELKWQKPKEPLGKIIGERKYLDQAIGNLISNALKYTPSTRMVKEARSQRETKGLVEISMNRENGNLIIKVQDNGIGIPKEEIPKLFVKFARASNATAMYTDGSGLGLFIVKEIIEGHKGKVWVESEEGKGSTFYMSLPLVKNGKKV